MDIEIIHETTYSYGQAVTLGQHRLMLRPRDSYDMRIVRTGLTISPAATLSWMHDVYGNSVALASFAEPASELSIVSELVLRRYRPTAPAPANTPWMTGAPIAYNADERIVLAPFVTPVTEDDAGELKRFAEEAVRIGAQSHPLLDLSAAIHGALTYRLRFEEGTQAPLDTLRQAGGSCRDYAWLFIECARRLGYAARFVTGYLHNVQRDGGGLTAPSVGYSHAWAEIYVPGDGWIEFDPTNLLVADRQLIRIATTRTPAEAAPVSGSFTGPPQIPALNVSVAIREIALAEPEVMMA